MRIRMKFFVHDPELRLYESREFDVLEENGVPRYEPGMYGFAWIMGDAGEEVKVWGREFEIVEDGDEL